MYIVKLGNTCLQQTNKSTNKKILLLENNKILSIKKAGFIVV